jgi:phosphate transport system permease protein
MSSPPLPVRPKRPFQLATRPQGPQAEPLARESTGARELLEQASSGGLMDRIFQGVITVCALAILAIVFLIVRELWVESRLSRAEFGWKFFTSSDWDPVQGLFGALPFIYGTLVSSFLALLLAVPLGVGVAVFLTEICPRFLRAVISFFIEMLAAIPSVIYGLWGIFVLAPILRADVQPFLAERFGWTGFFEGPPLGVGMLAAGIILAIMIVPFISSITREVMMAVPPSQREAVMALGATRWETVWMGVLRNARAGVFGAIILALGRALGETMAVTMLIGNRPEIAKSLFAPGHTMASVIANEFTEATEDLYLHALVEIGLALFLVTIIVNGLAQVLIWSITRGQRAAAHA